MPGDRCGSVNPTRSKARQGAFEGGPPEHPGRPHEDGGNAVPRWMVATGRREPAGTGSGLQPGSLAPGTGPPRLRQDAGTATAVPSNSAFPDPFEQISWFVRRRGHGLMCA